MESEEIKQEKEEVETLSEQVDTALTEQEEKTAPEEKENESSDKEEEISSEQEKPASKKRERPIPPKQIFIREKAEMDYELFYVDPSGFFAKSALMMLLFSVLFRLAGCWGLWSDKLFLYTQILLPAATTVLFAATIVFGKKTVAPTVVPVLLGVIFFIFRIISMRDRFPLYHIILCIVFYIFILLLWSATVLGKIKTKWILVPVFGLPLLYHVFYEDFMAIRNTIQPPTLSAGLQEISVLFIMLAMLYVALAMKKKKADSNPELPKIKDPIVKVPESANKQ